MQNEKKNMAKAARKASWDIIFLDIDILSYPIVNSKKHMLSTDAHNCEKHMLSIEIHRCT